MARIRVDTEDLRNKAKDFDSAADAFNKAGDDILATAMSMPSYDGQLSGPARKAGYEIQSQSRDLKANLSGDAQSLQNTAQAFEAVDSQTVNQLGASQSELSAGNSNVPALEMKPEKHGDSAFGYEWDPITGELKIYHNGEMLAYDTTSIDTNTKAGKLLYENLEAFKINVVAYETAKDTRDVASVVAVGAIAVFGLGFFPEPASVPMIVGGGITALISIGVAVHESSACDTAEGNCETLWTVLRNGNQFENTSTLITPTPSPTSTLGPSTTPTPTDGANPSLTGTPTPYNPTPTTTPPTTPSSTPTNNPTTTPTPTSKP